MINLNQTIKFGSLIYYHDELPDNSYGVIVYANGDDLKIYWFTDNAISYTISKAYIINNKRFFLVVE